MPKQNYLVLLFSFLFLLNSTLICQTDQRGYSINNSSSEFGFGTFYSGNKEFIEISYGIGKLDRKNISTKFHNLSANEIILGRRFLKPRANYKLIKFEDNYLFSSFVNDYQNSSSTELKISYNIWRFGPGYRKGYGYNFGSFAILPYHQLGLAWNKINLNLPRVGSGPIPIGELETLKNYDNEIKFGTSNIGGVEFRLSSVLGIGASYETSTIFPYYRIWQHLGSFLIETLSQTGIDYLTEGVIIRATPALTPILYFLLKNGLSYYLYTQKQDDMHWPFETKEPLTYETLKFSLKVSF